MMIDNIEVVMKRHYRDPSIACDQLLILIMDSNVEYRTVDYNDSLQYIDTRLRSMYNPKQVRQTQQLSLFDIGDDEVDKKRDPDLRWNKRKVLQTLRSWIYENKHLFIE